MTSAEALTIIDRAASLYGYTPKDCAARLRVTDSVIRKWRGKFRDGAVVKVHGGIADNLARLSKCCDRTEAARARGRTRTK